MDTVLGVISNIRDYINGFNPLVIFIVIGFLGMFVFWKGCIETHKNMSSVFDMFIFSSILSVILSRVSYIIIEIDSFLSFIWYWLPYEKYGEKIYLFRLLPWRFFAIWDGGLIMLIMFIGFILSATFYALVIKKWRWRDMLFPIYYTGITMLGFFFLITGFVNDVNTWMINGGVLLGTTLVFFILFSSIEVIVKNQKIEKYFLGYMGLILNWISSIFVVYIYITSELSPLETFSLGIFIVWSLVMGILFILDLKKVDRVSIEI